MPAARRPRVRSYDVFDTCLVRTYASGWDLVAEAARRLVPPGPDVEEIVAEAVRLRVRGEARARKGDACTLADVYAAIPELADLGLDPSAMHACELQLEQECLRPVARVRDEVARARADGARVVFVSDMHLPSDRIRAALVAHGVAETGDPVYVSGDLGLSKRTGRLFDTVLREQGVAPGEVVHRGDDEDTDLRSALRRGLRVDPFPQGRLDRYEQAVQRSAAGALRARSRLAAVSRVARLAEPRTDEAALVGAAVGASVVGPLLAGFVAGVLADARARGVATLCFVSRDGQVLHELAQRLRRPGDPRCLYLYGSRQAWFLPSTLTAEPDELAWVFTPAHEAASVRSLLAKLGLEPADAAADLAALGLGPDDAVDPARPGAFADLLVRVRPQVLARAQTARGHLRAYLTQEGVLDGAPFALVDVGWLLNGQAALRRVLWPDPEDPGRATLRGYYLALQEGRRSGHEAGPSRAWVREDVGGARRHLDAGWLLDVPNLVEHVFVRAEHGSCLGYDEVDGRVVPRLAPLRPQPEWHAPLRAAALRFTEEAVAAGLFADGGAVAFAAGSVTGRLLAEEPSREEARLFGGTPVSDDQNENGLRPLAPPVDARSLAARAGRSLGLVADGPGAWRHWAAASRVAASRPVRGVLVGAAPASRAAHRAVLVLQGLRARRAWSARP